MKHLITTRANTVDTLHAKTPMLSYKPLHTDYYSIAWARIQDYLAIAQARIAHARQAQPGAIQAALLTEGVA
jgi:hypothetical protein